MSKRLFLIQMGRYGGEFTMGKVSPEFVEYWQDREEHELMDHMNGKDWGDEDMIDANSPPVRADEEDSPWFDYDDLAHFSTACADGEFYVTEIKLTEGSTYDPEFGTITGDYEEIGETMEVYGNSTCTEELYTHERTDECIPVLMCHSSEKGEHVRYYLELDGDFDTDMLFYSTYETDYGEFIERLSYGEKVLEDCYDWVSTDGKGMYMKVGWTNPEWLTDLDTETFLECVREHLEYMKEEQPA